MKPKKSSRRSSKKVNYAIVGTGSRSRMYGMAILKDFKSTCRLAGLCDVNQTRMDFWNTYYKEHLGTKPIPTYKAEDFDEMIRREKVDRVVVTSMDRTHHRYICRAMELGCDVISEKPMTTHPEKCQQILDTIKRTKRDLRVTFNYRYAPRNSKVKELLMSGVIGDVLSVHFEWLLDTSHGANYFRRWHRDKRNSGGLMVHKATHHFDLVNWWINSRPKTVFAMGGLKFYGQENAEERGITTFYEHAHLSKEAPKDPFALMITKSKAKKDDLLKGLYYDARHEDGYIPDYSVFGSGISIEDDMGVLVRYESGATMTYHLTAYSPWEGYRVGFNGTKGRLEYEVEEQSYVSGEREDPNMLPLDGTPTEITEPVSILVRPHWQKPIKINMPQVSRGGHGGGDTRLLNDVFLGTKKDPLGLAANHVDGAYSILTGMAANRSFETGLPVDVSALVTF